MVLVGCSQASATVLAISIAVRVLDCEYQTNSTSTHPATDSRRSPNRSLADNRVPTLVSPCLLGASVGGPRIHSPLLSPMGTKCRLGAGTDGAMGCGCGWIFRQVGKHEPSDRGQGQSNPHVHGAMYMALPGRQGCCA